MRILAMLTLAATAFAVPRPASADTGKLCGVPPQVMIVLDRSGTMKEATASGGTKWKAARDAIDSMLNDFSGQMAVGLMLFSRWDNLLGPVSNCKTGAVNAPPSLTSASAIRSVLNSSYPSGDTPATNSLIAARSYLSTIKKAGTPQYVILITDGKETCSPNWPDTATDDLLADGVETFVVGFAVGADQRPDKLDAAANAGGTGSYYKADDSAGLSAALKNIGGVIACCGNGEMDAGEACDTAITTGAGACPTACDDNRTNTKDTLENPDSCNARCSFVIIPPPPVDCGNGKIDKGETCDIAIAKGDNGACLTAADCDDNNACTKDTLTGSKCAVACTHLNTCPIDLCGNGVLDPNEKCDPGIAAGKTGYCPKSAADCFDDNPCTTDSVFSTKCNAVCQNVGSCPVDPCGNGTMDDGELCDVAIAKGKKGYCPRDLNDCNDNDTTTADSLIGSRCAATCDHKPTTTKPVCGNGIVETGEWCDTIIAQGLPGACPRNCDDQDDCTRDTLLGDSCLAHCTNTSITDPINTDGCCPKGATGVTDNDCGSSCGNGVVEPGETCDPGIANGKAGSCPKSCPEDKDPCTAISLGGSPCSPQCVTDTLKADVAKKDGCCPAGLSDEDDADCLPPCTPDRVVDCYNPCKDVVCPDGEYCQSGTCGPWPGTTGSGNKSGQGMAGGCECEVGPEQAAQNALPFAFLLGLLFFVRRRRRG